LRKLIAALVLGWLLLVSATPASAHAQLVIANPKSKSTVYVLPAQVKLMFSDDLIDIAGGNQIEVTDPKGKRIDTGANTLLGNQLATGLKKSTALGRYKVIYRVLSEDGHPVSASYYFTLAKKPATKK
jgi:methionine-rich copper-binding protein CopC